MAKKSSINKNAKRMKMAKQMAPKRARLKAVASDRNGIDQLHAVFGIAECW